MYHGISNIETFGANPLTKMYVIKLEMYFICHIHAVCGDENGNMVLVKPSVLTAANAVRPTLS